MSADREPGPLPPWTWAGLTGGRVGYSAETMHEYRAQEIAAERGRISELMERHCGISLATVEYLESRRRETTPHEQNTPAASRAADRCTACAGSGEDFNEGDPCHVCHGRGVIAGPAAPEPHIDGWPLYSGLPPAAPAAEPVCRSDGRCQYAIDSGAEGLGHCPKGKCIMPAAPAQSREPLTAFTKPQVRRLWINSPEIHADAASYAAFARIVGLCERAHGIGSQP